MNYSQNLIIILETVHLSELIFTENKSPEEINLSIYYLLIKSA
jgi:hypothetical protein